MESNKHMSHVSVYDSQSVFYTLMSYLNDSY